MKVVISLLTLFVLWWLIQIPSVANAIMLFCAAGVNPFTGREMAPTSMVELLSLLLAASVLILFRKEVRRLVQSFRRQPNDLPTVVAEELQAPQPGTLPSEAVTFGIGAADIPQAVLHPLPELPHALAAVRHASTKRPRRSRHLKAALFAWWRHTAEPTLQAKFLHVHRNVVQGAEHLAAATRAIWRGFEPYARRFDTYLERKAHQNETVSIVISLGREMEYTFRSWTRCLRALRQNEVLTDLRRNLRR
jgi:hypothetical protein